MTPKEFDKLIETSPFAEPSLREKLLKDVEVNHKRPSKIKKLFLTYWKDFLGCAFLLWAALMIYITGALLF